MEARMPVAEGSPYPSIQTQGKNAMAARAVLSMLGGNSSEMTTVAQYFYSSAVLRESCPKAAEYFHKIAMVEMRHLSLLADLALSLGGDPRLWSYQAGRPAYWSSAVVTYSHEPAALLTRAVTGENRAVAEYRRLGAELRDPCAKALTDRLILDEEQHLVVFQRLLKELC